MSDTVSLTIPMTPPSVNHYVTHYRNGAHVKTDRAKTWEAEFALAVREQVRGRYVTAKRFLVHVEIYLGPKERLDVDNGNKCVLDCVAHNGLMRNKSGRLQSDSHVKSLLVNIYDSQKDRKEGPRTIVTVTVLAQ